jgi:hypothetical protein
MEIIVSILCPTRKRVPQLKNYLNSIISTVYNFSNIEILLAVDNDDVDTFTTLKEYQEYPNIKYWNFERQGYQGLYNYSNFLASQAKGKFIQFGCDDNEHLSYNWDLIVKEYFNKFAIINPLTPSHSHYCRGDFNGLLYPFIPKKWVELTGRLGNNTALDSWVQDVANLSGVNILNDDKIIIESYRYEETSLNSNDLTYLESKKVSNEVVRPNYFSEAQQRERYKDSQVIKQYLNSFG